MRYKMFGRSGLRVSELCLGAMTFGTQLGWGSDREQSRAVFDAFAESGGNFIDSAYIYMEGESERMLGDFVRADRSHFIVSTKYGISTEQEVATTGASRKAMRHGVDESLRRLGTDYIDLYWLHAWDSRTPVDELMRGLDDLVSAGKVLYVGISNAPAWQIARANMLADLRGRAPFVGLQTEYHLLERTAERDLLPMCGALDLAVTAWSPLAGGILSGKFDKDVQPGETRRAGVEITARQKAVIDLVSNIARSIDAPTSAVAIAALRQLSPDNLVIPILGARTTEQLRQNLRCLDVTLDDSQLAELDAATAILRGSPHDTLDNELMRHTTTGGYFDRLEHRRR